MPKKLEPICQEKLSTRTGTDCDREILNITFTGLGYETIILENFPSDKLLQHLKQIIVKKVQKIHSSLVLCILSHGKRNEVYCVDGIPINVEEIEKMVSGDQCPKLLGKPKLIFIQACQGSEFQKAVPCIPNILEDNSDDNCNMPECDGPTNLECEKKIPPTADLQTFWATVPGFATYRHRQTGTIFVQTLCSHLLKQGHYPNHLQDIVRLVNNELSKRQFGEENYVSMPQVRHTLTKKLYFPYSPDHKFKAAQMLYLKFLIEELINHCIIVAAKLKCLKLRRKQLMNCITE